VGMWAKQGVMERFMGGGKKLETPREFKNRMAKEEKGGKDGK
jgi:hypothetical protein